MPAQSTTEIPYLNPKLIARFWARVAKGGPDACWEWQGNTLRGYGRLRSHPTLLLAHRFSWTLANQREIPSGLLVLHSCDRPTCVNPAHLSVGANDENMADMVRKGRQRRGSKISFAKLDEAIVGELRRRFAEGATYIQLAHEYEVHPATVNRAIIGEDWKSCDAPLPARWPIRAHHNAKLTPKSVTELRNLHAEGLSCSELGRRFGISPSTVLDAILRKTWKHVP